MLLSYRLQSDPDDSKHLSKAKRTRSSNSKVRTGCLTCKTRRVKCDEGKPTCLRCKKSYFECGYRDSTKKGPTILANRGTRIIFPKTSLSHESSGKDIQNSSNLGMSHLRPLTPAKPSSGRSNSNASKSLENIRQSHGGYPNFDLLYSLSNGRFKSQQEYLYYQYFCSNVAEALSGSISSNFWNQLLLQASDGESFLRDAIVAIGAIHKITQTTTHLRDWDAHQEHKADHEFALEKYHESLRCMRKSISDGQMDTKTALIGSLLTVCFENACGHRDVALINTHNSLKLLQSCTKSTVEQGKLSRRITACGPQVTSDVEDDLSHAFYRLDINASLFVDYRTAEEHWILRENGREALDMMPSSFSTLSEATLFADPIMNRAWHFVRTVQSLGMDPVSQPNPMESPKRWADIQVRYGWNPWTDTDGLVPQKWIGETKRCADEMKLWITAFMPLFHRLQISSESSWREYFGSALLLFQAKICLISIYGSIFTRETDWDIYLPEYQEIISLAEICLNSKLIRSKYTFDNETTIWLYYVVCKCRDSSVRTRAMKLLRDIPKRDGPWDTRFATKMCQWVIDIETAERSGDFEMHAIMEEERIRIFQLDYDSIEGGMRFYCSQGVGAQKRIYQQLWSGT